MKKVILAIITSVFVLTDVGAVTRIQCRIDTARGVVVIPAVEGGADVAVAVIDRSIGVPDTTVTIASQLLMQSDLRGHVEDAAWYLRTPRREAGPAADALMLTQGWTRYDMPAAIRGEINDSLSIRWKSGAARRSNPLEMARKATRRGHRQRPCSAHGRRRFRHNRLTWPLLDKGARMARLHCTRNQRHERKGQTRREHPPRIRFLSCHHVTPRG